MMMVKFLYVLTFTFIVSITGFKISSTCVKMCESASSLLCADQCKVDNLFLVRKFGQEAVNNCLRPCRCSEKELAYPGIEGCESLQTLAVNEANCRCVRPRNLQLRPKSAFAAATINPWENWCKHQCAQGLGGSACYCDIIP